MFPHVSLKRASACLCSCVVVVCVLSPLHACTNNIRLDGRKWWSRLRVNGEFDARGGIEFVLMAGATVRNTDGVY